MNNSSVVATLILTDDEKAEIEKAIRVNVPSYYPETYEAFMSGCLSAAAALPSNIHKWSDRAKELKIGLIRNLPIDSFLPTTPTAKHAVEHMSMLADSVIGTISALFGTVYTIEGKGSGRHIHNMYPVPGDEYTQLGSSSQVDLEWHTEEAFHPARPDWLSLLCLRGDVEAATKVARAKDLRLEPDVLQTLREFRFKLRIDETYTVDDAHTGDTSIAYVKTSVLTGANTDPEIVLDPAYTIFEDETEIDAVEAVAYAAERVQQEFTLTNGDLLIVHNRRVVHGRTSFRPRMDGTDRWLKRAYILEASKWTSRLKNGVIPFDLTENDS